MAGEYPRRRRIAGVCEELEREAADWIRRLVDDRESETEQTVEQPPLGDLEAVPTLPMALDAQIGHDTRQTTRTTQVLRFVLLVQRPVADPELSVVAT